MPFFKFFDIILNDAYKNKEYSSRIADGVCTITIISWADDYESSTRVVLKIKEGKIISASRNYESLDERSEVSVSYTYGPADVNHNKNGYVAI